MKNYLHKVEITEIYSHRKKKNRQINNLVISLPTIVKITYAFTKFRSEKCESKFPFLPHCAFGIRIYVEASARVLFH